MDKEISRTNKPARLYAYPKYRYSGVEWLGEIPMHWEVYPLRRKLFSQANSVKIGPFGSQLKLEFMTKDGFKVYGQEHVINNDFKPGNKYIDPAKFKELASCEIRPNDLVITMMGSSGRCALVPEGIERGIMDSHLLRIRIPELELDPSFLCLLIDKSAYVKDQISALGKGAIMHGLNSNIIKSILLAIPPRTEQQRILAFLDREMAKIDGLVEKKEKLIELLKEKRATLITQAVAKGLDPTVPMKDSGAEWLGKIPAHWQVKKIKRLCLVKRGASPRPIDDPTYFDDEGEYSWVRIGDVTASSRYLETTTQRLSTLGKSKSVALEPEELFLSIAATIGKPIITKIKCCIHDGFVYFEGLCENREYLYYIFSSGELYKGLGKFGTQLNLNTDTIGDIFLPIPSAYEQQSIVDFLDRETARIDALVEKIQKGIDLLKEYRSVLISAAVTGKIDVRNEV